MSGRLFFFNVPDMWRLDAGLARLGEVKHQSLAGKTGLHLSSLRYGSRKQAHSPQICFACAKHRQAFNVKEEIWLWFPKNRKIAERQFLNRT